MQYNIDFFSEGKSLCWLTIAMMHFKETKQRTTSNFIDAHNNSQEAFNDSSLASYLTSVFGNIEEKLPNTTLEDESTNVTDKYFVENHVPPSMILKFWGLEEDHLKQRKLDNTSIHATERYRHMTTDNATILGFLTLGIKIKNIRKVWCIRKLYNIHKIRYRIFNHLFFSCTVAQKYCGSDRCLRRFKTITYLAKRNMCYITILRTTNIVSLM